VILLKAALSPPFFIIKILQMGINVNTVYQTVLLILNKEQRGYLTPYEFNNIATQVQLEIFEEYFETENQQLRIPQNESEYSDRQKNIDDLISPFKEIQSLGPSWIAANEYDTSALPTEIHRIGTVIYKDEQEVERVERNDWLRVNMSKLTRPSADYPLYLYENNKIIIQPPSLVSIDPTTGLPYDQFYVSYVRKPKDVVWAYTVDPGNGAYLYSATGGGGVIPNTGSQDFEINSVDQVEVVLNILKYTGVVIRDPQIVQAASQELAAIETNQKR
tara:strand:+ start:1195 stop:2019 length:825 start_codon:yes stop_codon:yes gene_type:complete